MNSPELAGRAAHLGAYIRFESTLTGPIRELAILTTVREFECIYPWTGHVRIAREEGVADETIEVIADNKSVESLDPLEQLVIQFARQLLRDTRIDDSIFDATKDHLGTQGVVELAGTIGYYSTMSCVLNAVDFGDQTAPLTVTDS
jgi:4-carboxymuconolactone decarboxylase